MARFDVYRTRDGDLMLDCQADTLDELPTRFVVPLVPVALVRRLYPRLNPLFSIEDVDYFMATQMAAAVSVSYLARRETSLGTEQSTIMNALDMLLTGY